MVMHCLHDESDDDTWRPNKDFDIHDTDIKGLLGGNVTMWVKDGTYARIRTGALVGQDMGYGKWVDEGEIFRVSDDTFGQERKRLTAYGYGVLGDPTGKAYGNGSLFVKDVDVIYESNGTATVHYTPEAQKVQDEWEAKLKMGKLTMNVDHEVLTAPEAAAIRIQAINDVGAYVRLNYNVSDRAALVPNLHIKALESGKIPG